MVKHDADYLARLKWKCRRGMLELDCLLERFVENKLQSLDVEQIKIFENLLEQPDPVLLAWLMGHEIAQDKATQAVVELISGGDNDKDV